MTEFDENIYDECNDKKYLMCKVCSKQIVRSYHKKHLLQKSHMAKLNDFNHMNFVIAKTFCNNNFNFI